MNESQPADAVEQFLGASLAPEETPHLRAALLDRTLLVIRRRRWHRRFALTGALAASFLAGVLCASWLASAWQSNQPQQAAVPNSPIEAPASRPPSKTVAASAKPMPTPDAVNKEWAAFDRQEHRGELYREAGDLYVRVNHDYEAALRCYSQALEHGADEDLTIAPDDNWLIMALKEARQKEKRNANGDS